MHETYAVGVCLTGAEGFRHGRGSYVLTPGQVVTINPDEVHTGEAAAPEGWEYRMFYPHPDLVRRLLGLEGESPPVFTAPLAEDREAAAGLAKLHAALCGPDVLPLGLARAALFTQALAGLFSRHAHKLPLSPSMGAAGLDTARERMAQAPADDLTLEELAATAGLSPWHFLRSFKQRFGLTPHVV